MTGTAKKKTTIYDLSIISGISASTVSAVLSGTWRKRRIKEATAELIQKLAREHGYTTNLQARGLRSSRSGLVALLLPEHENRYFSSLAQYFEAQVRSSGRCPIVVSACRDPGQEHAVVEALISYSIDELLIVGAADPDGLHTVCEEAGLKHVNLDLPGSKTPSVLTDNYEGGRMLTQALIGRMRKDGPVASDDLYFFGSCDDHATCERIRGFHDAKCEMLGGSPDACIEPTGYSPVTTARAFEAFYAERGRLPRGVFINSLTNLEGLMRFLEHRPENTSANMVAGCFDYDPFASFLPFPLYMIHQDAQAMIARGLAILRANRPSITKHLIAPALVSPRAALLSAIDALKDSDSMCSAAQNSSRSARKASETRSKM